MILEIVTYGHPVLRTRGRKITKVDDRLRQFAADLVATMHANALVGMGAQQVGKPLQMLVLGVSQDASRPSQMWIKGQPVSFDRLMPMVVMNPDIITDGEICSQLEGNPCLPGVYGKVLRPAYVSLMGYNLEHEPIEFRAEGLLARAVQHEFDHLQGILFIDRMDLQERKELESTLRTIKNRTDQHFIK